MDTNTKTLFDKISGKIPAILPSYARIHLRSMRQSDGQKKYHPARMMLTVLGINLIPLIVLLFGLSLMGDHRESLINTELELLHTRTKLYAHIVEKSEQFKERQLISAKEGMKILDMLPNDQVILVTKNQGIFLNTGKILVKSPSRETSLLKKITGHFISSLMQITYVSYNVPLYPSIDLSHVESIPGIPESLTGLHNIAAWSTEANQLVFSSSTPIFAHKKIIGAISVTYFAQTLAAELSQFQEDIFRIFISILTLSIAFSLYLVSTITNPLRKLVKAAESIHSESHQGAHAIPDMSNRGDEIGELSIALNTMVEALWDRMGTIESFASDVSHELKNPITSIKSALETLQKIKDEEDKAQLLKILEHDVDRLDRLITDISKSTRLDVELSHGKMEPIKVSPLIESIYNIYKTHYEHKASIAKITLTDQTSGELFINGHQEKLIQVLTNIIDNALSFSKKGDSVSLHLYNNFNMITISIQDMGVGISETHNKKIFERFYSDRPKKEGHTHHSGLGLSIVKQIVEAHNGTIEAHNNKKEDGTITGAVFTLILPIHREK